MPSSPTMWRKRDKTNPDRRDDMYSVFYIIGVIVVVIAVLNLVGLS